MKQSVDLYFAWELNFNNQPVHQGMSSDDHFVTKDSLVLLFSNNGRARIPLSKLEKMGGRESTIKK